MSEYAVELQTMIAGLVSGAPAQGDGEFPAIWETIVELGLVQVGISEERGGAGGGLGDLAVVASELARWGLGGPYVEAAVSAWALADSDAATFGTIVLDAPGLSVDGGTVSGMVDAPWGADADRLVFLEDDQVLWVPLTGRSTDRKVSIDIAGLRRAALTFDRAPVVRVADAPDADEVRARLGLLRSAALLGAARGAFDLTKNYVSEREQFGAPLIKLPAVASALAHMSTQIKQADVAIARAVSRMDSPASNPTGSRAAAAVARVISAGMATAVAQQAHQLHGAMGVAREYPLHTVTTKLWAWRDEDETELQNARYLGALALSGDGDRVLWEKLTA